MSELQTSRGLSLLHPIERAPARAALGIADALPFNGDDLWTGYEFSWLDNMGKPRVAGLRLRVSCASPNLVESKSMKFYLNGFAQLRFVGREQVAQALEADLTVAFGAPIEVELIGIDRLGNITAMPGKSLDDLEVVIHDYERNPNNLGAVDGLPAQAGGLGSGRDGTDSGYASEIWHTHLFRSLCPITGQPDWASIMVDYTGPRIAPDGLLRYLVSFRCHAGFHEDTIERIFVDLLERCRPAELSVYGRFQRRGGLDINPYRSTQSRAAPVWRLARQ